MISSLARLLSHLSGGRGARRYIVPSAAAVFSALLAYAAVGNLVFLANANQFIADTETAVFAPPEPQEDDIVIVAITEDTLSQFVYRAPLDRQFMADLLTSIAEKSPRAVGVDFLFDQPTETDKDAALKEVLTDYRIPLFVAYTEAQTIVSEKQQNYLGSFVPIEKRALVTLVEDQFDVVRWILPGEVTKDGSYVMGLSRALANAGGAQTPNVLVPIVWRGSPATGDPAFKEYPAHAVKLLPAEWFKDKIVLVGSDVTLVDRHRTPYTTTFSGGEGLLPGVVIQAHAVSQLLHGRSSPVASWPVQLAISFGLSVAGVILGMASWSITARVGTGILLAAIFVIVSVTVFHAGGPQVGIVEPNLSLAMSFFVMEAVSGSEARAQREFIKTVFSQHVAREVVNQIIQDPTKMMSLEGERRFMTFLFTDVADFTTMSENVESKELARVLNAYLEGMTDIVQKYSGMVDKFIGDAVFAIFNAPIDLKDHSMAAVMCALEMDQFSLRFSSEQNARSIPFGRTRIGIHTGTAVIGNFGSRMRHNYTASGDAVNTASRLEGLNKYFGTRISVSGETRVHCTNIRFRPIATVVLKGKTSSIDVFEPLAGDDPNESYLSRYCHAYTQLKNGDENAKGYFEALQYEAPDDPLVAFHLERINDGTRGVEVIMTEK